MKKISLILISLFISFVVSSSTLLADKPKELEFEYLPCYLQKDKECNEEDPARASRGQEKFVVNQTIKLEALSKRKDPLGQVRSIKARSRSTWIGNGGNPQNMR